MRLFRLDGATSHGLAALAFFAHVAQAQRVSTSTVTTYVASTYTSSSATATIVLEDDGLDQDTSNITSTFYTTATVTTSFASIYTTLTTLPPDSIPSVPSTPTPVPDGIAPPVTAPPITTPPSIGSVPTSLSTSTTSSTASPTTTSSQPTPTQEVEEENDGMTIEEEGEPEIPLDLALDERVLYLTYLASVNRASCLAKAQEFADDSSSSMRRRLAEALVLPAPTSFWKRLSISDLTSGISAAVKGKNPPKAPAFPDVVVPTGCAPSTLTVPLTVHWVAPAGRTAQAWANDVTYENFRNHQLEILNRAFSRQMYIQFDLQNQRTWSEDTGSPGAPRFSRMTKGDSWGATYARSLRQRADSNEASHLNIFIVDSILGANVAGYCKFAGIKRNQDTTTRNLPDGCVIQRSALFLGSSSASDRLGTTLPHEVGHWLNLFHTQTGGCDTRLKDDLVDDTPRYAGQEVADGAAGWGTTCDGKSLYERNTMSYSDKRSRRYPRFTDGQMARAMTGLVMRRAGYTTALDNGQSRSRPHSAVKRYLLDQCYTYTRSQVMTRRDSLISRMGLSRPLTKRQAANIFSRFCDSSDLTISGYQFSGLGDIYNISSQISEAFQETATSASADASAGSSVGQVDYPMSVAVDGFNDEVRTKFNASRTLSGGVGSAQASQSSGAARNIVLPCRLAFVVSFAAAWLMGLALM